MNERIRELADQAGIHFGRSATLDGNNIARFVTTSDMEKFAELIVRECLKLLVTGEGNENTSDAIWDLEELGVDVSKLLDDIKDEQ
jgi:hypothetical protein